MTFVSIFQSLIIKLYFPSLATTVHKQLEDYSTHQFVSELGGAAGIVLGVSLFTIIKSKPKVDNHLCRKAYKGSHLVSV